MNISGVEHNVGLEPTTMFLIVGFILTITVIVFIVVFLYNSM